MESACSASTMATSPMPQLNVRCISTSSILRTSWIQRNSAVLHAEMDCLENAGRLKAADYRRAVLYSTLSPCDMCSGAILLYGIPTVVIGENRTFRGPEDHLRSRGVQLEIVDDPECRRLMADFIAAKPELWNEDIGET